MDSHIKCMRSHARGLLLLYALFWLALLGVAAGFYIERTDWVTQFVRPEWLRSVLLSLWFAMLGTVAISLKGISDHSQARDWASGQWNLWYLERPFAGMIVGVVTYALLQVANTSSPPTGASLAAAAFILGMQEKRFFGFLAEIAKILLTTPADHASGFAVAGIQPNKGAAGDALMVSGQGLEKGVVISVGSQDLTGLRVSSDASAAAGLVPPGSGTVDVLVVNPDGTAKRLAGAFTYIAAQP